jgi:hypothetical protein
VLGKLFKHVGENNVIWGADSIWYGSPQDQIQAFRTFQIAPELRDKHGYPTITPELRQKVFAYNAAKPYNLSIDDMKQKAKTRRGHGEEARLRAAQSVIPYLWPADAARVST